MEQLFVTTFDSYTATHQIGEGGTGVVNFANAASDGRAVAIKTLKIDRSKKTVLKRFQNEITFSESVQHTNIVRVLDRGVLTAASNSAPFYVMPFYELTLRKLIEKGLGPVQVLPLFLKVLNGVEAAHLHGVWHRDLKPENILLNKNMTELVVADFGIAHFKDLEHYEAVKTKAADRLANFRYCAPEQAHPGAICTHTSDIYALGLILNEMFTNQVARGTGYRSIKSIASEFAYLDPIVERMIRQDPNQRFQSIDQIKSTISTHSEITLTRQTIDAIKKTVVDANSLVDPLIENPIRIKNKDWKNGRLIITLTDHVPPEWKRIFAEGNRVPMFIQNFPGSANWTREIEFSVPASEQNARAILNQYEAHLASVNAQYEMQIRSQHAAWLTQKQEERTQKIKAEEARLRVLQSFGA